MTRKPLSPAERQRRRREREQAGIVAVAPVAISARVVEAMLELGMVDERAAEDRLELGAAVAAALEDMARRLENKPSRVMPRGMRDVL